MPRLKNGMARVEFLTVCAEAEVLLGKGHPCSSIYERFKADGKISMSYRAFHRYLKGKPLKKTRTGEASAIPTSHAASAPAPESTLADQALVPARSGPIQAKGNTSKFNANDFDIDELGPTKEN